MRILDALQRDGRISNADLADRVGLSASQVSRRRNALEQNGLIQSFAAILDRERIGLPMIVFVEVTMNAHSGMNSQDFARLVSSMPEVQEAYSLTGDVDYLLKIAVRDLNALSTILNQRLLAHPTVGRIRSSIVLDRLKETTALPLDHLIDGDPEDRTA